MEKTKTCADLKDEALTVLGQWRGADRRAIDDKADPAKQRAEYQCRKKLRTAADCLTEVQHHG